jgi:transcriptional regulator with XRE-family HTH domain
MGIEAQSLGLAIKEVRQIRKLTQKDVADKSGLTVNYLSLVENGARNIQTETLNAIAKALRVPTQWIVFLGGEVPSRGTPSNFAPLDAATKELIRQTIRADSDSTE